MTTNPDDKKPKQVLATYAVIALIVMFLLNIFVLPGIMERSIRETTYSDFLKGIDSKQIQEVQFDVQDSIIYYTLEQDGKTQVCKTGLINTDSELIDKITSSGADLTSEIPTQQSPLMNMLIGFILPTIIFIFLGQLLFKKMTNSMTGGPGGAMSFGKSNAKVYVKSSTGIKFSDVAGEDEAKDLLTEIVNKFDFEQLPGIYAKLYPGANGFVFTFVGNIDPETLKPLVEKYIGSIPAARKPINYVDDKAYPVKGEVTEEFTAPMQQPKVSVNYHFSGEMPYTLKNKMALTFLTQALNSRYLVSIREEKGGTYGVRVQGSTKYIPRETYSMTISFDTNEEMADELREIVMKEIEEIAANGPKSEDIEKNREFMLKSWKNSLEQNGAWMSYIQIKYGSGLNYIADHEQAIRDLTNADVQALAKKILADGNLVKVVMRPSK